MIVHDPFPWLTFPPLPQREAASDGSTAKLPPIQDEGSGKDKPGSSE